MTTIEALILGIIQGLTEFFPISSSGHLKLAQHLLGFSNLKQYILFDLVCHLGTLLATLIILRKVISTVATDDIALLKQIMIGTLPLFPLLLIMKPIKALFDQPTLLGYCFLITAFLLYVGIRLGRVVSDSTLQHKRWRDAFFIGCFQAFAILPGVSRSGSTISAGRLLGWKSQDAVVFSMLLAIPAMLGGTVIETLQLFSSTSEHAPLSLSQYVVGFLSSFVVGFFALRSLIRIAANNQFIYFVWYCLFVGSFTLIYFNA